jgi:hypothetical protein
MIYQTLDLLAWHQSGQLVLSPKFQRRMVWGPAARSYFIDTLLRGFPVPAMYFRRTADPLRGDVREVIDGQQRLRALFDFIVGDTKLSPQLSAPWAGKRIDSLTDEERARLFEFQFQVNEYPDIDDEIVLEIFARINMYSIPLNAQELRNGRFFGKFKQSVYALALEYYDWWLQERIFTHHAIARMDEAQLVSELLVLQLDGLQDKKNSLNEFYRHLDEDWTRSRNSWRSKSRHVPATWLSRDQSERRFRSVLSVIDDAAGDLIPASIFRRTPIFYTLYSSIYHRLYGVPNYKRTTPERPLDLSGTQRLRRAMEELTQLTVTRPDVKDLKGWQRDWIISSARQTDNVGPRRTRLDVLWRVAGLDA